MPKPRHIKPAGRASDYLCLMVFGPPDSGKTTFFGTAPNNLILRPPTDHTRSIRVPHSCEEWVLRDWNDWIEALDYLRAEGYKNHEWVTVDSVSQVQDYGLDHVWAETLVHRPDRGKLHAGLDKGEYGRNMVRLSQNMRDLIGIGALGFNVGITAHTTEGMDEDGNPVLMPWVQGKGMSDKIAGYMDIVGYLRERKVEGGTRRELITKAIRRNGMKLAVKDQTGKLRAAGGIMADPTIPKLMAAIGAAGAPAPTKRRAVRRTTRREV